MSLPEIQDGIIYSILPDIDDNWAENTFNELVVKQPILAHYISAVKEEKGEEAALTGLVVYKMLESQQEANELTKLLGE